MIENKVAIITGAAGGIGYACAKRFIEEGAKVILSDIDEERGIVATQKLDESGKKALFIHCDVSKSKQVESLFVEVKQKFGRVDVAIANAGIVLVSDILELEEDAFDQVISVNLKGVFLTGQIAARHMIGQEPDEEGSRGNIINM
ncbi:MAG: SDR family NAD(P)-dependent oxidoreductase, partial [Gammaproteobacteria bacterium]|nr:SDR family NAD(P)-dependent oxidoreductase [Gammaproteobacteria bacterium]